MREIKVFLLWDASLLDKVNIIIGIGIICLDIIDATVAKGDSLES
jgi:hypothetical protein